MLICRLLCISLMLEEDRELPADCEDQICGQRLVSTSRDCFALTGALEGLGGQLQA